jgi:hypothetical protein
VDHLITFFRVEGQVLGMSFHVCHVRLSFLDLHSA